MSIVSNQLKGCGCKGGVGVEKLLGQEGMKWREAERWKRDKVEGSVVGRGLKGSIVREMEGSVTGRGQ